MIGLIRVNKKDGDDDETFSLEHNMHKKKELCRYYLFMLVYPLLFTRNIPLERFDPGAGIETLIIRLRLLNSKTLVIRDPSQIGMFIYIIASLGTTLPIHSVYTI